MYDFIFQEQWWVETIVSVIIAGSLSFAIATMKGEKDWEGIENSNARMEKQNSSILDRGESQTRLLSSEHKDLSNEHKDLSNEHRDLFKEQSVLKSEIQKVIANQEKEKAVREAYGKVIPEGDTFKHMADAIYMHSVQLQQEVNALKNQIVQLENKNRDLKQQIIALKERLSKEQEKPIERHPEETEKNEYDEILDNMDLSPDSHDEEEWER